MTWRPKLKEAFGEIAKAYVPGCVAHYEGMDPNPWKFEHDILTSILKDGNDIDIKKAIDVFETNCKALIARYQK